GPTRPILFCQPLQGVGGLQVLIPRLAQPAAEITLTGALLGRCRVALVPPRTRALLDLIPGTQPPLPTPGPTLFCRLHLLRVAPGGLFPLGLPHRAQVVTERAVPWVTHPGVSGQLLVDLGPFVGGGR